MAIAWGGTSWACGFGWLRVSVPTAVPPSHGAHPTPLRGAGTGRTRGTMAPKSPQTPPPTLTGDWSCLERDSLGGLEQGWGDPATWIWGAGRPQNMGLGSWETLTCAFRIWGTPAYAFGASCCSAGVWHGDRPGHGQPFWDQAKEGKKAGIRPPGFRGALSPPGPCAQDGWSRSWGAPWGARCGLSFPRWEKCVLSPARRPFSRIPARLPPLPLLRGGFGDEPCGGSVPWGHFIWSSGEVLRSGQHSSAQPPRWEGPETGPVATERAKNSGSHGGCRKASEHAASEPASSRGWGRPPPQPHPMPGCSLYDPKSSPIATPLL